MVELNSQIDDSIMKMMITMKLPELFHIRTHYMHDQKLEISLEDFNASIMQFKAEIAIGNLACPAAVEAHKISISLVKTETEKPATPSSSSGHKDKERPKCVACGKTGHWMVDCHLTKSTAITTPPVNDAGITTATVTITGSLKSATTAPTEGHPQDDSFIRKKAEQLAEQRHKKPKTTQH
jgi:hypothetical protein